MRCTCWPCCSGSNPTPGSCQIHCFIIFFCSTANLESCEDRGFSAYISTSHQQHGQRPRPSGLRPTQNDCGARIRPDQGCPRSGSVPIARAGEGERGTAADGHHAQPALAACFSEGVAVPGIAGNGLRSWLSSRELRSDITESQDLNHRFKPRRNVRHAPKRRL